LTSLLHIKYTSNDLIFILPPLAILLARTIVLMSSKLIYRVIIGSALTIIIIISTLFNLHNIDNKPEYNQLFRYIAKTDTSNNKYGICWTGIRYPIIPTEANKYYLKKNDINVPIFSFDGESKNIKNILITAKEKKIDYL
jgi:hypothetical protein